MGAFRLDRFLELWTSPTLVWGTIGGGFAILTVALLALMLTRLGQANPLRKCVILSLFAHSLLAAALSTVQIATSSAASTEDDTYVHIVAADEAESDLAVSRATPKLWDRFSDDTFPQPRPDDLDRMKADQAIDPDRMPFATLSDLLGEPKLADLPEDEMELPIPNRIATGEASTADVAKSAEPIETEAPRRQERPEVTANANSPERAQPTPLDPTTGRDSTGGLPKTLLNQATALPRLSDTTSTPQPESSLLGPVDSQPKPAANNAVVAQPGLVNVDRRPTDAGSQRASSAAGVDAIIDRSRAGQSQADITTSLPVDAALPQLSFTRRGGAEPEVPGIYKLRMAPNRAQQVQKQGGTEATEAAVNAALNWLAANQEPDGRWSARRHGAGREDKVLGHDRQGAGARADTGLTGLALLAFLGAGHTHADGAYQEVVARGLEFLIRSQGRDGNLAGEAELYAFMYCHGMAAIALSEAFALTHDELLELPLRRAIAYTLAAQNPASGGWRYRPADRQGDTSQLGWQLMALKSAKLAGVVIPAKSEEGMIRFLRSVAAGQHKGLASYRPNERPTATMTAEALVCRHFLGLPPDSPFAAREAGETLLKELPGVGKPNLYYWYYATLAMHQLGGEYWRQWNDALSEALVNTQVPDGPQAGSWDTNDVWGGYGGRVYTTAMGALCLEVYYRFLPLYERPK